MSNNGNRMTYQRGRMRVSKGPAGVIRGQAKQIADKYASLAQGAPEHEKENLLQHREYWIRQIK